MIIVVETSLNDEDKANDIAKKLLDARLAACVSIIKIHASIYWWQGEMIKDTEWLLRIKTSQNKINSLVQFLKDQHPYQVPEIISYSVDVLSSEYQKWLLASIS